MVTSAPPSSISPGAPGSTAASKIFLIVAVLLGVLATGVAFVLIRNAGDTSNSGPKIMITVAKHDIPANQMIDPDRDLRQMPIPREFAALASRCLDWEARQSFKGMRVNRAIYADQPVMLGDLAEGLGVLLLEKPYYALTIPADPGMITPGDYVKLIVARSNLANAVATMPVAGVPAYDVDVIGKDSGYKVLAVGAKLSLTRQQTQYVDSSNGNTTNAKTITLEVTEAQSREIVGALGASMSNKAILLLCPSPKTASPSPEGVSATDTGQARTSTKP